MIELMSERQLMPAEPIEECLAGKLDPNSSHPGSKDQGG